MYVTFVLLRQSLIVADQKILIVIVEVHTIALAELPHLAVGTLALLRPTAVAELLEAILPHIPEVIAVDVSLGEVTTHRRASRDVTIHTNGCYADASVALKWASAHLHLIATYEALARV